MKLGYLHPEQGVTIYSNSRDEKNFANEGLEDILRVLRQWWRATTMALPSIFQELIQILLNRKSKNTETVYHYCFFSLLLPCQFLVIESNKETFSAWIWRKHKLPVSIQPLGRFPLLFREWNIGKLSNCVEVICLRLMVMEVFAWRLTSIFSAASKLTSYICVCLCVWGSDLYHIIYR